MDIGPAPEKIAVRNAIGIDLGLTSLATLSDGQRLPIRVGQGRKRIVSQKPIARSQEEVWQQESVKAKERLRRVHQRIAGLRIFISDGRSEATRTEYDLVAHEKLNIRGMAQSRFAKSIMDAAWNQLYSNSIRGRMCREMGDIQSIHVVQHQLFSGCGEKVPKKLWKREHNCPNCGLSLGRDHNAALNI